MEAAQYDQEQAMEQMQREHELDMLRMQQEINQQASDDALRELVGSDYIE